jgi:hypothetical protein
MEIDQIIDSKIKTMTDLSGKKSKMLLLKDETEIEAFKQQLRLHNVSSMFSAKQMEKAFNDGVEAEQQRCGEFNIENYY